MRLQDQLDQRRANFESGVPEQTLKVMHTATQSLTDSNILTRVLKKGEKAPFFTLSGPDTENVSTKALLEKGPLVVNFFRGSW